MSMPGTEYPPFVFVLMAALILSAIFGFSLTFISHKTGKPLTLSAYGTPLIVVVLILGVFLTGAMFIDGPGRRDVVTNVNDGGKCLYPYCENDAVYLVSEIYTSETYGDLRGEYKRAQSYIRRGRTAALDTTLYLTLETNVCAEHFEAAKNDINSEVLTMYHKTPGRKWITGFGICGMILILWSCVCIILNILRTAGVIKPRVVKNAIYDEKLGQ
jgi:hypothetical protein